MKVAICGYVVATLVVVTANAALAAGNPADGANLFKTDICSACHAVAKGAPSPIGPNLFGVVGRKAGSLAGYSYSPAMKGSGITWDADTIAKYIMAPAAVVPGNKMVFAGVKTQQDADSISAYLSTLK